MSTSTRVPVRKLLVIRLGAMGDLLHVSPSIRQACQIAQEVHFLTSPLYVPLVEQMEGVTQVWTYDKKRSWPGLLQLANEIRAAGIDGVINLHPSFKTWLLTRLIAPKVTAVYRKQKFKTRGKALRQQLRRHAVEDFNQPFQELLGTPQEALSALLPEFSVQAEPQPNRIGLIPGVGGKRGNRAWPVAFYKALIHRLLEAEPQCNIVLIGGPDETALAESLVVEGESRLENHCGRRSLLETAALLKSCRIVISGDTGPLHLAAAVGVPIISLFGPTAHARTGPVGNQSITRFTPPDDLECWPCELPTCPLEGKLHHACMNGISVLEVYQAYKSALVSF